MSEQGGCQAKSGEMLDGRRGPPMALYPLGTAVEKIRQSFTARYGHEPEKIVETAGGILAGPI
jgi:hypothetical protein